MIGNKKMDIKMINYTDFNGNTSCFAAHRVVRLSKGGEYTKIHLDTGEIIESIDTIKALTARIENKIDRIGGNYGENR